MGAKIEKVIWRPVREEELEMVMNWRMQPEITKYMYTDPVLTIEQQRKWYQTSRQDKDNETYMIEVNEIPAGILNITDIDRKNQRCTWGYYVAVKELRSLDLALMLEWNVYDYAFYHLGLNKVAGEIFSFNKAVLRIHQMCGSEIEGKLKAHIYKNGEFYDVTLTGITKQRWEAIKENFHYAAVEMHS